MGSHSGIYSLDPVGVFNIKYIVLHYDDDRFN